MLLFLMINGHHLALYVVELPKLPIICPHIRISCIVLSKVDLFILSFFIGCNDMLNNFMIIYIVSFYNIHLEHIPVNIPCE